MNDVVLDIEGALGVVASAIRLSSASSPDASNRMPERFLLVPSSLRCTTRASSVFCGVCSATLGYFLTCCGSPAQPARIRIAPASQVLRMNR